MLKKLRSLLLIDYFHKADVLIINNKKSIVQLVINWFKNTLLPNKTQCYLGKGMNDFQIRNSTQQILNVIRQIANLYYCSRTSQHDTV